MNLDSGAENLFDIKAEAVIAGNQKLHSYLPHITIPDIDQNITEKVSPQLKFNIMYFLQKDDIMLHFTHKGSSDITGCQCLLSYLLICLLRKCCGI